MGRRCTCPRPHDGRFENPLTLNHAIIAVRQLSTGYHGIDAGTPSGVLQSANGWDTAVGESISGSNTVPFGKVGHCGQLE